MILYPITKLCWGEEALIIIAAFVLLSCVSLRWTLVDSIHFHSEDIRHSTEKLELLFFSSCCSAEKPGKQQGYRCGGMQCIYGGCASVHLTVHM